MVAKSLLYLGGRGVVSLPLLGRRGRRLRELRDRLERERAGGVAVRLLRFSVIAALPRFLGIHAP